MASIAPFLTAYIAAKRMRKNKNNKDNQKTYTSRDEFINDDNLSNEEKTEICEAILEAEKGE